MNLRRMPGKSPTGLLNIAHRGARAFAPENTLAAFEKSKRMGCHMFELDVRLLKDGKLLIHHDEQLTRCTDAAAKFPDRETYYVTDFSYEELSTLDAGSWYIAQLSLPGPQRTDFLQTLTDDELDRFVSPQDRKLYASGEIKLPTLKQALEFAARAGMLVNIELKTHPGLPGLADAVVALVERMALNDRVLISSFDHGELAKVRKLTQTIATGLLTSERTENLDGYLRLIGADAYNPNCHNGYDATGNPALNLEEIRRAREYGYFVNAWTCNNKDDMRQLIAAGVTGLISDFPNRVAEVLTAA
jgi:glycerophosphoryl diester phosphodiesterase